MNFISSESGHDVLINVHSGRGIMPGGTEKVFDAPYVEEINGIRVRKKTRFWNVNRHNDDLFIKTSFPLSRERNDAVLKFSLLSKKWDLWINGAGKESDPLEYPLDGLILYYLTAIHGDIMIHASGINHSGKAYLFSGVSGKGKTTLAKLWDASGARVISDDRLIIRNTPEGFRMHNTPVYKDDEPRESGIDKIFLIGHGNNNEITIVTGASAESMVISNCIQHSWNREIMEDLMESVSSLCMSVPVFRLEFRPDHSVIDEILSNE